jgi:hypothetical protein
MSARPGGRLPFGLYGNGAFTDRLAAANETSATVERGSHTDESDSPLETKLFIEQIALTDRWKMTGLLLSLSTI